MLAPFGSSDRKGSILRPNGPIWGRSVIGGSVEVW